MATLQAAIRAVLEADSTLTGILTGGIHDASELDREGLTVSDATYDSTTGALKPTAVIRWRTERAKPPHFDGVVYGFEIYFYEQVGFTNINSAKNRCYTLLNRQQVTADNHGLNWVLYVSGIQEFFAEDLKVSGAMQAFSVTSIRS